MKTRNSIFLVFALIVIVLLALLLRGVVQEWVILPLAKFVWLVKGYYGAFSQAAYWVVALGIAGLVAILSFRLPDWEGQRQHEKWRILTGSIREISFWIQRCNSGVFPKWHVAHLLAELALDILDRRRTRQKNTQLLTDPEWVPPAGVKNYLEAALTTNYTDYPKPKRFMPVPSTPFDQDLEPILDYLESLLESEHDNHS